MMEKEPSFLKENFEHPPQCFRGTPFWAWNCKMTPHLIQKTADVLNQMGMGGAYLHSRTGMDMPYLGPEFMDMVHEADRELEKRGMATCLYDEDRWPSGYGGGLVTADEKFRSRFLLWSPKELKKGEITGGRADASAKAVLSGNRRLLGIYDVELTDGWLTGYRKVSCGEECKNPWFAYLEICGDNPWFNNQAYADTLNPKAVQRFLEVTYEAYFRELGDRFGTQVPVIFTDEPQFSFKEQLGYAQEKRCLTIPYTDDFEETYVRTYGESFLDHLPEIFWDLPDHQVSVCRYRYHDHVCQRFTESYADQIGAWCRKHGILLTGHMMREPFLEWQTMALGEAMRSYRSFGIPGIDMLCDRRELTTAKQAQSAVHQYDAPGMTSELYGVTNWDFDFRGHKLAGDWQAALGVTRRVHHLTWTSMKGEAKRDYPASIGSQSPWYKEYSYIETYFARLNTILTRGKAVVKIGVIHPIESYWLYWGTREQTAQLRQEREEEFVNLVKWLLYGLMDFDFISEALLAGWKQEKQQGFQAGAMDYEVILVPDCVTLRSTTVRRLKEFKDRGGAVFFAGRIPEYVDAQRAGLPDGLVSENNVIPYSRHAILKCLSPWRVIDIHNQMGIRSTNLLYQMRKEEGRSWLFAAHSEKPANPDLVQEERLRFQIRGCYQVKKWNPLDGSCREMYVWHDSGQTFWEETSYEQDSFLYELTDADAELAPQPETAEPQKEDMHPVTLPVRVPVTLEEPNVLLLDRAEYAFDEGPWQPEEDLLRIDNRLRRQLGMPLRTEACAQPWIKEKKQAKTLHTLRLRFYVESDCEIEKAELALEALEQTEIRWNGQDTDKRPHGWYVDEDIETIFLGSIKEGTNCLELTIQFDGKTPVENLYLLGDFGVAVGGRLARVTKPVRELEFGDLCRQGLPFYGGNITYHVTFELEQRVRKLKLQISRFRTPVLLAELDKKRLGLIACSPYCLSTGPVSAGSHELDITVFGSRVNTFGPVHNCNETETWIGPNAWRTTGTSWSYEYQLKPTGILKAPVLTAAGEME